MEMNMPVTPAMYGAGNGLFNNGNDWLGFIFLAMIFGWGGNGFGFVESTGVVTGVAQGTAKITGKFTSPYETDGIVYNVTVTPKAQPANIFWG